MTWWYRFRCFIAWHTWGYLGDSLHPARRICLFCTAEQIYVLPNGWVRPLKKYGPLERPK